MDSPVNSQSPECGSLIRHAQGSAIKRLRIGIAADRKGSEMKEYLVGTLREAGHEVIDFSKGDAEEDESYSIEPLVRAITDKKVDRCMGIFGNGANASATASQMAEVRARLTRENLSMQQGIENEDLNLICFGNH
jgi:ribose 5-phosphate isomerase RpiB